jgi:LPS export ABC transporter protein LptC
VKKLKKILAIGILCFVAFWIGLYAFRTQKPATPPTSRQPVSGQVPGNVGMKEINFSQVIEGVKLWELKAEEVEYQKEKNEVSFKKVTVTYFPKGQKPVTLVGNQGRLNTQSKDIFIEGEVRISSEEGYELSAPALHYEDQKREVWTDGEIVFRGPRIQVEGQGMAMNLETQKLQIKSKARMIFQHEFLSGTGGKKQG